VLYADVFLKIKNCFHNAYFLKNIHVRISSSSKEEVNKTSALLMMLDFNS